MSSLGIDVESIDMMKLALDVWCTVVRGEPCTAHHRPPPPPRLCVFFLVGF